MPNTSSLGPRSISAVDADQIIRRALSDDDQDSIEATRQLFRDIVEPACDSFHPAAVASYVRLFARIVSQVLPHGEAFLLERYDRVRRVRTYVGEPKRVCVLSRVTLGADIVVTSVLLDTARRRFPNAEIWFAGPQKNAELFAGDNGIKFLPLTYGRSARLRDRVLAATNARDVLDREDTLVIDTDSRFTQLGLIPVCEEGNYLFFESRAYGGESNEPLAVLTARWAAETLGVSGARPFLRPVPRSAPAAVTVSLGVGENEEKLAGIEVEREAIAQLTRLGVPVLIDCGGGGEEAERVEQLREILGRPSNLIPHRGSFASFAAQIARSRLYFGYDSAGQHVAAASGVPLVTVFAGYACERTFQRWRPTGPGFIHTVKVQSGGEPDLSCRVREAITSAAAEAGLS